MRFVDLTNLATEKSKNVKLSANIFTNIFLLSFYRKMINYKHMGVATFWPKGPCPPPFNLGKIFFTLFGVFYVLSCNLFAFYNF